MIEEELYEGRLVSEEEHQIAQKRIPYANVGLAYECIAPEVKEHEVKHRVKDTNTPPSPTPIRQSTIQPGGRVWCFIIVLWECLYL